MWEVCIVCSFCMFVWSLKLVGMFVVTLVKEHTCVWEAAKFFRVSFPFREKQFHCSQAILFGAWLHDAEVNAEESLRECEP